MSHPPLGCGVCCLGVGVWGLVRGLGLGEGANLPQVAIITTSPIPLGIKRENWGVCFPWFSFSFSSGRLGGSSLVFDFWTWSPSSPVSGRCAGGMWGSVSWFGLGSDIRWARSGPARVDLGPGQQQRSCAGAVGSALGEQGTSADRRCYL